MKVVTVENLIGTERDVHYPRGCCCEDKQCEDCQEHIENTRAELDSSETT